MHDIKAIDRLNVEGFLQDAEKWRAAGKHVLITFDGLHITGAESFASSDEAFTKLHEVKANATESEHFKMLLPAHDGLPAHDLDVNGESSSATPAGGATLSEAEEKQMVEFANTRDEAERALCAAAREYTLAQAKCTVFADKLRQRVRDEHNQGQLFN